MYSRNKPGEELREVIQAIPCGMNYTLQQMTDVYTLTCL